MYDFNESDIKRFWSKVYKTDKCWLWTRFFSKDGYGAFTLHNTKIRAHRLAYELTYGPIPDGLQVLHHCDMPFCVRPDHLFLGTVKDNVQDMLKKNRHQRENDPEVYGDTMRKALWKRYDEHPETWPRGERARSAKLTEAQVREIRQRYAAGGVTQLQLCAEYGVTSGSLNGIITRRYWKHVP
jgi:HNH endonuclease